jgi:hypothetical protein
MDSDEHNGEEHEFARSEKAAQASQLNLSARLSKEGTSGGTYSVMLLPNPSQMRRSRQQI